MALPPNYKQVAMATSNIVASNRKYDQFFIFSFDLKWIYLAKDN
jgi:hypothetical protein